MASFAAPDVSGKLVAGHSQSSQPLAYRIGATWSNHEGSMMLWVLILTLFAALVAWRGGGMPERLLARVLSVQGAIAYAFLLFAVVT